MTTLDPRQACGHCRYWQQIADDDGTLLGNCRRHPPHYEGWPRTLPGDWCGDFVQRIAMA